MLCHYNFRVDERVTMCTVGRESGCEPVDQRGWEIDVTRQTEEKEKQVFWLRFGNHNYIRWDQNEQYTGEQKGTELERRGNFHNGNPCSENYRLLSESIAFSAKERDISINKLP